MQLYCAPLACSLATSIGLYEAGASAAFTAVIWARPAAAWALRETQELFRAEQPPARGM